MKSKRFLHYPTIIRHNNLYFQTYYDKEIISPLRQQMFIITFYHLLHLYVVFTITMMLTRKSILFITHPNQYFTILYTLTRRIDLLSPLLKHAV